MRVIRLRKTNQRKLQCKYNRKKINWVLLMFLLVYLHEIKQNNNHLNDLLATGSQFWKHERKNGFTKLPCLFIL